MNPGSSYSTKGWWFGPADDKLLHDDGRLAEVGVTHCIKGELIPCENALHMTKRVIDALPNAAGLILWRVEAEREIIFLDEGIMACRNRKYLARADASATVLAWARRCTSNVAHLWNAPQVVKHFLATGEDAIAAEALNDRAYMPHDGPAYSATRMAISGTLLAMYPKYQTDAAIHAHHAAEYAAAVNEYAEYTTTYDKYATWLEEDCRTLLNLTIIEGNLQHEADQ